MAAQIAETMSNLDLQNTTFNQHFLSQAEQRLNASNPDARRENQRIYEFDVVDREAWEIRLRSVTGRRIQGTSSWHDLFSFDVAGDTRSNLERLFQNYENDISRVSESLLTKLRGPCKGEDIKAELIDLFALKFLNFMRNPYSVPKALATLGEAAGYFPTDPELRQAHELVREGSKPHREAVCRQFGLTPDLYDRWLRTLFNLLIPLPPPQRNIFDHVIKDLFEQHWVIVAVHQYASVADDGNVCLLSDRGFNMIHDQPELKWAFVFEFNITSRAFASFAFCDVARYQGVNIPPEVAEHFRSKVQVNTSTDDVAALVTYNQRTVYQCARTVFAADQCPRLQR